MSDKYDEMAREIARIDSTVPGEYNGRLADEIAQALREAATPPLPAIEWGRDAPTVEGVARAMFEVHAPWDSASDKKREVYILRAKAVIAYLGGRGT